MEEVQKFAKREKAKTIISYVINAISIAIMILAVIIVAVSFASKDKGYTAFLGKSYFVVQSDSMKVDEPKKDNFQRGDIISIKILNDAQKQNLQIGDVITFYDIAINGDPHTLNTHRITAVVYNLAGGGKQIVHSGEEKPANAESVYSYMTKGDNPEMGIGEMQTAVGDVIGVFAGKASGFGNVLIYMQSKTGFMVTILIPCALVMVYCGALVIINLMKYSQRKAVLKQEENVDELKAKLREELLKEMQEKGSAEKAEEKPQEPESENKD